MTLTVSSRHSIDDVENWVKSKFSSVENKQVTVPDLGEPVPFPEQNLGKFIRYVPIKDEDELSLVWILPYSGHDIDNNPLGYFSHLLGHEG